MNKNLLGETLKQRRFRYGLSLDDVSKRTGLSKMYISEIERGVKIPIRGMALCELAYLYDLWVEVLYDMAWDAVKDKMRERWACSHIGSIKIKEE